MHKTILAFHRLCLFAAVLLTIAACEQDLFPGMEPVDENAFAITLQSDRMLPTYIQTRAADPKDDAEKAINQFYLFFFDKDGQYLKAEEGRFYGFQMASPGSSTLNIDREILKENVTDEITVWAVANVEEGTFTAKGDGTCTQITNMSDLEAYVYTPKTYVFSEIPSTGIPMVGKGTVTVDQINGSTNYLLILMKSLMARIDVSLQINSEVVQGRLPQLSMRRWTAVNVPKGVPFTQPQSVTENGVTTPAETNVEMGDDFTGEETGVIYNSYGGTDGGTIDFTFYMFENMRQPNTKPHISEDGYEWTGNYPEGVTEEEWQRYKPCIADEMATHVDIEADYYTYNHQGDSSPAMYDVTYSLYLGADHTDDFNVTRNHQYKNDVTIKGLTKVGNNPDHITFDARVNIREGDNNFYISILRERNHDAHFCVTPMDIYMFGEGQEEATVEVTLGDDADMDGKPWVRMERIPASIMESGSVTTDFQAYYSNGSTKYLENPGQSWHAGTGKRRWFTTGLMEELNGQTNIEKGVKGKTCTMHHRDRIYFYVDENLSTSDRSATVHFKYTYGTTTVERDMVLTQVHLLPVEVYDRDSDDDGNPAYNSTRTIIYMEQYEEYLQHYDPLDEFVTEQIYDGLPWEDPERDGYPTTFQYDYIIPLHRDNGKDEDDLKDETIGILPPYETIHFFDIWDNHYYGRDMTSYLCDQFGQEEMNLNEKPESAAEYCYNRNKRQGNGLIPYADEAQTTLVNGNYTRITENDSKWFLPGIRQMEDALRAYYTRYESFRTDFYWSSAPAYTTVDNGIWGSSTEQNPDYARSTKIENGKYVESHAPDLAGYRKRSEELRIRAFRIDLEPYDY